MNYLSAIWQAIELFWIPLICTVMLAAGISYFMLYLWVTLRGEPYIDIDHLRRRY